MPVTTHVHTIALKGIVGLMLLFFSLALVFYILGFSSIGWTVKDHSGSETRTGLWVSCTCNELDADATRNAARAMITIGLCGILICAILIAIYLLLDFVNKTATLTAFTITIFVSVIFMLIGYIIWGVEDGKDVGYSFILSAIGAICTLVTGIVSLIQMRNASII